MGGIAGIYYLNGHPAERNTLGSMVDVMAHRGPDGMGTWCEGAIGLGHLMLHTTPESLKEKQPIILDGGQQVLVADATLYNRDELIGQLDLSREGPVTDSALILAAYRRW
jgi:asparagine synthase (glutamine-hydrolysing)